jgi:hypothetical protein
MCIKSGRIERPINLVPSAALFVKSVSITCSGASESRRRHQPNENARLCQKSLNDSKLSFTCPSPTMGSRRSILARRRNLPPDGVGCFVGFGNNVAKLHFWPPKVRNSDRIVQRTGCSLLSSLNLFLRSLRKIPFTGASLQRKARGGRDVWERRSNKSSRDGCPAKRMWKSQAAENK